MKRDQSISLTYLPPRVRVVETCPEQRILTISRDVTVEAYVDESENVNAATSEEKFWVRF